jgi:hypothetical protein
MKTKIGCLVAVLLMVASAVGMIKLIMWLLHR